MTDSHTFKGKFEVKTSSTDLADERLREDGTFQARVQPWMMACFGPEISADKLERNDRFMEEALELVQATGYPKERAYALIEYVYGRDQGEINQEVGGVMVTLAAHCLAHGVDMHAAAETELARIWTKVEKIRAKQAAKPTGSALPIARNPSPHEGGESEGLRPCPFCGAPGRVFDNFHPRGGEYWVAECSADCEMVPTCTKSTEAEARAAWNRRPTLPVEPVMVTEGERELVSALTLAADRIEMLLGIPDDTGESDHPGATRYILDKARAALSRKQTAPQACVNIGVTEADIERAAEAVYALNPFHEGGDYVDHLPVSPGHDLSWEEAKARDAQFAGDRIMLPVTKFAYDAARASLNPPKTVEQGDA